MTTNLSYADYGRMVSALEDIAAMTYDSWTNGAIAKEIAEKTLADLAAYSKYKDRGCNRAEKLAESGVITIGKRSENE